nr:MAG TPA: hypothetical protein [Caudoviricetes sp.]
MDQDQNGTLAIGHLHNFFLLGCAPLDGLIIPHYMWQVKGFYKNFDVKMT